MKNPFSFQVMKTVFGCFFLVFSMAVSAQTTTSQKSDFWQRVQIGGGIGVGVGSGYTDVSLAPSAIYNFNPYVAAGVGLQGAYLRSKNSYEAYIYGGSLIGLFNPIEQVQISAELEQVRVSRNFAGVNNADNFWNTALFLGAGYRAQNVTIGVRYNVLYSEDDLVYGDAFMPFVRVYF
jgi:hypothetical protein